jgi:hypothetical protein
MWVTASSLPDEPMLMLKVPSSPCHGLKQAAKKSAKTDNIAVFFTPTSFKRSLPFFIILYKPHSEENTAPGYVNE